MKIEELNVYERYYFLRVGFSNSVCYAHIIEMMKKDYLYSGSYYYDMRLRVTEMLSSRKTVTTWLNRCVMPDMIDKYEQFNDENKSVIRISGHEYLSKDKESLVKIINDFYYKGLKNMNRKSGILMTRKIVLNTLKKL